MKVCKMNAKRTNFVIAARALLGEHKSEITRPEIYAVLEENESMMFPQWVVGREFRTEVRGVYYLPSAVGRYETLEEFRAANPTTKEVAVQSMITSEASLASSISVMDNQETYVPEKYLGYVPWGNFNVLKDIIKSEIFFSLE